MSKSQKQDIAHVLASKASISPELAEYFLENLQIAIEAGLSNDKLVKINRLGTFKLIWNEPRMSINVQTKEQFEIEGHYKLSYQPDKVFKESINKPFEHLEVIELGVEKEPLEDINISKLNQQANEIKESLKEIQAPILTESIETVPVETISEATDSFVSEVSEPEEKMVVDKGDMDQKHEIPLGVQRNPFIGKEFVTNSISQESSKPRRFKKVLVVLSLLIVLILILSGAVFVYMRSYDTNSGIIENYDVQIEPNLENIAPEVLEIPIEELKQDSLFEAEVVEPNLFSEPRVYDRTKERVVIQSGDRLTLLALKYYGHRQYWVYIYEANSDVLSNPNSVEVGMELNIPELNSALIDTTNRKTIEYAKQLQDKYIPKK